MTICPLRGAGFRPPAKGILAVLPINHPLELEAEPENSYDNSAIKVNLRTSTLNSLPGEVLDELELRLAGFGSSLDEVKSNELLHVGYVGKEFCLQILPYIDEIICGFATLSDPKEPFGIKVKLKPKEVEVVASPSIEPIKTEAGFEALLDRADADKKISRGE